MTTKRSSPRQASSADIIAVHKMMDDVLEIIPDVGCRYPSGWTDIRIAEERNLSVSTIRRIRKENFGELIPRESSTASSDEVRLKAKVSALMIRVDDLEKRVDQLMSELGVQ